MRVLITGVSSGLGAGLAQAHLDAGDQVYGVSRRQAPEGLTQAGLLHAPLDLSDAEQVGPVLGELLGHKAPDLVYLNAGVLGPFEDLREANLESLRATFDTNLWAQKTTADAVLSLGDPGLVVAISSGASVRGRRGWSGYALSKAALNMLVQLYAAEAPKTHWISLAPGLIDTAMQDQLCGRAEDPRYPSIETLKAARGKDAMPEPKDAGERIRSILPRLRGLASGSFADLRKLSGPSVFLKPSPLEGLPGNLPENLQNIVARTTPIPSIAGRAAEIRKKDPRLVRADIGQISGFDPEKEVLYGPPTGLPQLREALAESFNLSHGLGGEGKFSIQAGNVCVTTGAAEGLSLLFRCFAQGKVVGVPRGFWSNYRNGSELANAQIEVVDFFDEDGWLDVEGVRQTLRDKGIEVLVANFPCNPTGAVLDEEEARNLAQMIREENILAIADEVYDRLRYDGHPPLSLMPFAPQHIVSVSSASKEYLLPGARVGYVLTGSKTLAQTVLGKLLRASSASPNVLGQERLLEFLEADLADLRAGRPPGIQVAIRDGMQARRDQLLEVLEAHGLHPSGRAGRKPEGTIFFMVSVPDWFQGDDEAFAETLLEEAVVSTVPGSAFGLPGTVRFSYGGMTPEEISKLGENLSRLREKLR